MTSPRTPDATVPVAVNGLIERLATAMVASRVHPPAHPAITRPVAAAVEHAEQILADTATDSFSLIAVDDGLSFEGRAAIPPSLPAARLLEVLARWHAVGLRLLAGITRDELTAFLRLLVRPDAVDGLAGLAQAAAQAGCRSIGLVASSSAAQRSAQSAGDRLSGVSAIRDSLSDWFTGVAAGADMDSSAITQCAEAVLATVDSAARRDGDALDLACQDEEDTLSVLHSIRVSALTMIATRAMTGDRDLVIRLGVAGLLHDVGRMLLPPDLMQTEAGHDESGLMFEHPLLGAEYLLSQPDVDPICVAVALGHHRTVAGDGYPQTAHEHHLSRFTQIVRIADRYEALTARRPQRPPMSPARAYRTLIGRDQGVDPGLVRRFIDANGIHPLGARVQLDSGEAAQVVRQTTSRDAPIVRILTSGNSGAPMGALLDLSRPRKLPVTITAAPTATG